MYERGATTPTYDKRRRTRGLFWRVSAWGGHLEIGRTITKLCTSARSGSGVQGARADLCRARFGLENANTREAGVDAALVDPFEVARGAVTDHPAATK